MNKYTPKGLVRNNETPELGKLFTDPFSNRGDFEKKNNLSPMVPTTYTPKNLKEMKGFKSPLMGRHCSED